VVLNIGQASFDSLPTYAASPWMAIAGVKTFDEIVACSRPQDRVELHSDGLALALVLLKTLAKRRAIDLMQAKTVKQTFESRHPYADNMHEIKKIEIKGARKMTITFDRRCITEENCDYVTFGESSSIDPEIDKHTGTTWPTRDFEGDTVWYLWHSDGSNNNWGWKFTVEAEIAGASSTAMQAAMDVDMKAIGELCSMMNAPLVVCWAEMISLLLECTRRHLFQLRHMPEATVRSLCDTLLVLARQRSDVGVQSAHILGEYCGMFFQTPPQLLRVQLQMWEEADALHPDVVAILSESVAMVHLPFGNLVDDQSAWIDVERLIGILGRDRTINPARATLVSRLLWRCLSDSASYLIAGRSSQASKGWARLLGAAYEVLTIGTTAVAELPQGSLESPPLFLHVLLLPLLHGLAFIPHFEAACWDDVVALLQPCGALASATGKCALPDLRGAALVLVASLGRALLGLGDAEQVAAKCGGKAALEALQSPCCKPYRRTLLAKLTHRRWASKRWRKRQGWTSRGSCWGRETLLCSMRSIQCLQRSLRERLSAQRQQLNT
jgi:hypothetical protein